MKIEIAHAFTSRFTPIAKALQLQLVTDYDPATPQMGRGSFGDAYLGSWCLVAPPMPPALDPAGHVTSACEVVGVQVGDQIVALGQRDVRSAKFAQDAKPGEVALFNAFGARLFLGQQFVSITSVGGAFFSFDATAKTVGLAGFPAQPGQGAPYLTISSTAIGLVSATGAASVNVANDQVTVSGASASINTGSVNLGTGASSPVAKGDASDALFSAIVTQLNKLIAYVNGVAPGTATPIPFPLASVASARVKTA